MKNPGHFGRGAGSDRKSTHFYNTRPAIGFAITLRTIFEVTEDRRLLAAEIGQALGGRKSGRGAAHDAIDAAQELPDHPDCPLAPDRASAARNEDSNAGKPKQADILIAIAKFVDVFNTSAPVLPTLMTCRAATTSTLHEWARRLLERCGSYAEITSSRKGIRILHPGDGG